MSIIINDTAAIQTILKDCKTIAVIGISANPYRPSFNVSRYMQRQGYHIIPVTPNETSVLGEAAYATLAEVPGKIDLVNLFRRADQVGVHVDEAIALREKLGLRAIWMQEDVIDEAAAQRALEAGLLVVMDRCLLKEHMKWRAQ